jgi:hypothetical protein
MLIGRELDAKRDRSTRALITCRLNFEHSGRRATTRQSHARGPTTIESVEFAMLIGGEFGSEACRDPKPDAARSSRALL